MSNSCLIVVWWMNQELRSVRRHPWTAIFRHLGIGSKGRLWLENQSYGGLWSPFWIYHVWGIQFWTLQPWQWVETPQWLCGSTDLLWRMRMYVFFQISPNNPWISGSHWPPDARVHSRRPISFLEAGGFSGDRRSPWRTFWMVSNVLPTVGSAPKSQQQILGSWSVYKTTTEYVDHPEGLCSWSDEILPKHDDSTDPATLCPGGAQCYGGGCQRQASATATGERFPCWIVPQSP